MDTMTMTLTPEEVEAFARVASGLNGGRFAHLVNDETVKGLARDMVAPKRLARAKRNAAIRQASKRERDAIAAKLSAQWLAEWRDYSEADNERITATFEAFKSAPKRSLMRRMAKALLRHAALVHTDTASCYCPDCLPMSDWRATVRQYRDARALISEVGTFAISRRDMTVEGRFYGNVVSHWHQYAGGRHISIAGVTPDDVMQDAFISAIEAGDTLNGVPIFGTMYGHTRRATESAVFTYRRYGNGHTSDNVAEWTWSDWQEWAKANDGSDRLAYSTLPEWQCYDAARTIADAEAKRNEAIRERREAEATYAEETRASLATLILSGMTVRRIATILGRTVEAIEADMTRNATDSVRFI